MGGTILNAPVIVTFSSFRGKSGLNRFDSAGGGVLT
jgi:hypothetical protein